MGENYTVRHDWIGKVPCLTVRRQGLEKDAPLVLIIHGLGSHKEKMLPGLYELAQHGYRAVAPDVHLHGERSDAAERDARLGTDYFGTTAAMIEETVQDLSGLLDHYQADSVGLHGLSLGGYITFAALLAEPRFKTAAVAMGSPDWVGPLRRWGLGPGHPAYDRAAALNPLDLAPHILPPRPLLMLHGVLDEVVAAEGVIALEERLRPLYAAYPERLELHLYPDLGHQYTDEMLQRSVIWFDRFLRQTF